MANLNIIDCQNQSTGFKVMIKVKKLPLQEAKQDKYQYVCIWLPLLSQSSGVYVPSDVTKLTN